MEEIYKTVCNSPEQTSEFAKKLALNLECGAILLLEGNMGAGKSVFARGIIKALGYDKAVTSPTFTLRNEYDTKPAVYHFDLYRLEDAGVKTICDELREYSEGRILTFVEWAEFSQNEIPFNRIEINVTYEQDDNRKYSFKSFGEKEDNIIEELKRCY